nr:7858_t:CDS:2 [Entrophospora candida]
MDKPSHNTTNSVGEAFKPFASLITTANTVINQIVDIFENAEYNKKICNVFLDRLGVAPFQIKNLERRKEENEYLFHKRTLKLQEEYSHIFTGGKLSKL